MGPDLLHTPMPAFPVATALALLADGYGIEADTATPLGSERDQLLLVASAGVVVKISNHAERSDVLEMENGALRHLATFAPDLPVPRLVLNHRGEEIVTVADPEGREHQVRVLTVVPGQHVEGRTITLDLAGRIGAAGARVSAGLRGYFHPAAGRHIEWDIRVQRPSTVDSDDPVADARRRIGPALAATRGLPSGVQHADLTLTNVLADDAGHVTGIVDLGDMHHTAAVCDLAVTLTSVLRNTGETQVAPWPELAAAVLDGYQRIRPLTPEEAELLGHLVLARLVTTVDISRSRADEHPDNRAYITQYDRSTLRLLEDLVGRSDADLRGRFARLAGHGPTILSAAGLVGRRERVLGGPLAPLFYREPVHVRAGEGAWLIAEDGRRYLDAYNNVAVAGHTHPAVTEAVVRQLRTLNTHSRYPHPAIVELAERLTATMPDGLDTCVFVTSGSEAVDLAWRMAQAYTGAGGTLVARWAYHGISTRTIDFSTSEWPGAGLRPSDVATFATPDDLPDGADPAEQARARVAAGVSELDSRGHRAGLLVVDPQFTSAGILDAPDEFMHGLADGIHTAGGLFLADEVQSGFGRCGPALWRFATMGLTPDLVALGKPMAAGLPVGAVITRREIADALPYEYFSTFAASPVAGVAGCAVLDVLADRALPARAVRVGDLLRTRLRAVAAEFPVIAEVRGYGLIAGVDLRAGGRTLARAVVEGLRQRGVLAGSTGPRGDVLKVRPPLVWTEEHVDVFVTALRATLIEVQD